MSKKNKKKEDNKIRVNITVDKILLEKAKTKLNLFGGKLSTLFNSYLHDFVNSIDKTPRNYEELARKVKELENSLERLEKLVMKKII